MYDLLPLKNDPAELARLADLLRTTFRDPRFTAAYLDWMYFRNPVGEAVGRNAVKGGELGAHYVTLPIEARVSGTVRRGLLSLNTATHPAHQGQKLFTRLAEATYRDAADRGYQFVMGVANANSTPGFIRKLGFDLVCPLEAKLGVGAIADADDDGVAFVRSWSPASLAWRLARPSFPYTVTQHRVFAPTGKLGIKVLLFRARSVLPRCDGRLRTPLTLYLGVDPALRWARTAYFDLPRRFRPSPLNLILKNLGPERFSLSKENVLIQALDFDAY